MSVNDLDDQVYSWPLVWKAEVCVFDRAKSKIGVVVIGRNEGDRLIRCFQSLQSSAGLVVYVDSGSTDGSVASAEIYGASVVRLSTELPFTAGRGRNAGFRRLRELSETIDLVQFIDGDCQLDSDWLQTACVFLDFNDSVAVVCGRRREMFPGRSIFNWLCDLEWNTPVGEATSSGGDFLVRANIFETVGGFRDEIMAGEEPELCSRIRALGCKIWRLDAPMTAHDANINSFAQWWRRTRRTGYGYTQVFFLGAGSSPRLYLKELLRALFWGGALPFMLLIAAFVYPWLLIVATLYVIPLTRAATKRGIFLSSAWIYSGSLLVGKFAEFHGVLTYVFARVSRRFQRPIEYKS